MLVKIQRPPLTLAGGKLQHHLRDLSKRVPTTCDIDTGLSIAICYFYFQINVVVIAFSTIESKFSEP